MAVAYTINRVDGTDQGLKLISATVAYTAESYSSGLPLDKASLGCDVYIEWVLVTNNGPGIRITSYDDSNGKLRVYAESAGTFAEVFGAQTFTVRVLAYGW